MDDAAVVGIEGFGLDRPTSRADGLGEVLDFFNERIIAHSPVVLDIDDDPAPGRILRGEHAVHEVLEVIHHFVPATDKALGFVGEDLEDFIAVLFLLLNLNDKSEVSENGIEDFGGRLVHGVVRFFFFFLVAAASRFATTLFFSSVGSGVFRVR
jgi:hypothetical protein